MAESTLDTRGEVPPPLTTATVVKVLQGVRNWKDFGMRLLPYRDWDKLDKIRQQCSTNKDRLHALVEEWLKSHQPSWRKLIYSLDWIGQNALATPIRGYAEPPLDTNLTQDSVTAVMEEVKEWQRVSFELLIPDHILNQQGLSERGKKDVIGNYYLQTHPYASMEHLARELYLAGEYNAVEKAKRYLPRDPTFTLDNIMEVVKDMEEHWERLGEELAVGQSERNEISSNYQNNYLRMEAVLNFYIRYHPTSSWKDIATALRVMGFHDLEDVVATKYVRGPEERRYLAACEQAIKEKGSLSQTAMHCVFMGIPRSGKSFLIQRLLGKRPCLCASTGVAEKVLCIEIRKSTACVSGLQWCELEDLDDEAVLVMCNVSRSAPVDVTESVLHDVPNRTHQRKASSLSEVLRNIFTLGPHTKQYKQTTSPLKFHTQESEAESQLPSELGVHSPLELFREAFQRKWSKLKEIIDEPWMLYITDTGGQPEFQELLPILVCGPSVFFLVFPLHLELNKRFQVEYITSQGKAAVPYEAGLTVQEMLLQSLATIASTCVFRMVGSKKVVILPNIFFVATHKDLVSEEHIHQVDIALQEVVKGTEAYKDGMVQFASESQMIIAVNNLSEGEEDVQQIRTAVERIGKRGDDYRVRTPFSWLMFSNIMQQMKSPVLKYEQCYSVAQQCGIDTREEMNDALRFLHENVGVVRYYHDVSDLQDFVIKDPQYVFDMITDLIVATFTFDRTNPVLHEQFTKRGIFALDVFEKLARSTEFLPPSKLVTLLQHLNIVALLRKDGSSPQYFMPCVLAHSEDSSPTMNSATLSHIPPLLVTFKAGYVPKGLFGALVVYLLQNKMNSKLEWELEQDKIFRDQICLSVGPYDSFQLKVLPTFLSIELCASSGASTRRLSIASVCSEVQQSIHGGIDMVSEALHYSQNAACSFGFFCPEELDTGHSPHPATVNFLDGQACNLRCPLTHKRFDLPDGCQVWFSGNNVTMETGVAMSTDTEDHTSLDPNEYTGLRYVPKDIDLLNEVAAEIPTLWREMGLELGLSHHHLDCIETEQNRKQIRCFGEVLRSWREQQTAPYTWETIIRALQTKAVSQHKLAQILKKKFAKL